MFSPMSFLLDELGLDRNQPPNLDDWQRFLKRFEAMQQEAHNAYLALINNRDEAIFLFDLSFRIVMANQAAAKLLHYGHPEELIGHFANKHLSPEAWTDAQDKMLRLLAGESIESYERTLQIPDGEIIYTMSSIKLIRDGYGLPLYIQSSLIDITRQKQMEHELAKKEHYLKTILNNAPIILWACDEHGIIRISEGAGLNKLHRIPNSTEGLSVFDLYTDMPQVLDAVRNALEGRASDIQVSLFGRFYESRYSPVIENEKITGVVVLAMDMTETVLAQKAVQAEQAESRRVRNFIEAILNNSSDGIAVLDYQGFIQQNNMAFDQLFQASTGTNFNKSILSLVADSHKKNLEDTLLQIAKSKQADRLEVQALAGDGKCFYADLNLSPIVNEDKQHTLIVCSVRDMSSYKELQLNLAEARDKALETARLKSEFLAVMSHEIRTPLNSILGLTEVVLDSPLNEDQTEFLGIIKEQGGLLLYVINNILDYSKLGADKMRLELDDVNLEQLVQSLKQSFQLEAEKKHLDFVLELDEQLPTIIKGDAYRLRQILTIFLSNAFKFTHQGYVKLLVGKEGDTITFRISDSGIGISEAAKAQLFEPFTQADSSHTRRYGGTGLGLAIAQKIVQLMASEIAIESKVGEGTTFQFAISLH
jgi:PAS domain S-box-containing protein